MRNRVLVILFLNWAWFLHFSLEFGMFSVFKRSYVFIIIDISKTSHQTIADKAGDQGSSNIMIQGTKAGLRWGMNLRARS